MGRKKKNEKKNPIDPDKVTEIPGIIAFPHHLGSAVIKPEDEGKIKGRAMSAMKDQTERQLAQLYEQMKTIAAEATKLKKRVEVSEKIYQSKINFEPVIGHVYYLYEKKDHHTILSMIGPEEWGEYSPFKKFLASVKLLSDHTWEVLEDRMDH